MGKPPFQPSDIRVDITSGLATDCRGCFTVFTINQEGDTYCPDCGSRYKAVKISALHFELNYAKRSGLSVKELRALGRIVAPCDCDDELCEGWRSTTKERQRDA